MLLVNAMKEYLEYCEIKHFSKETIRGYEIDMRMLTRYLEESGKAEIRIENFGRSEIRLYVDHMENRYKSATSRRRLMSLRSLVNYLWERGRIDDNPFFSLRIRLRSDKQSRPVMSVAEVHKILYAAYTDKGTMEIIHLRDIAILEVLFSTGIRVQELVNLRFEQYCDTDHSFHFNGKGGYERSAYLQNREVVQAFRNYVKASTDCIGPIFRNRIGDPLSTQAVRNLIKKYAERAGLNKKVTPHAFRRTLATLLINDDMALPYVQSILGHKSMQTTAIYIQIAEDAKQVAICKHNPRDRMSFS